MLLQLNQKIVHLIDLELNPARVLQCAGGPQMLIHHGLEGLSRAVGRALHLARHVHRDAGRGKIFGSQDEYEIVLHLFGALDLLAQGLAASVHVDQKGRIHR